jgi:hypothetical protein
MEPDQNKDSQTNSQDNQNNQIKDNTLNVKIL